jgi:hypothetical protein
MKKIHILKIILLFLIFTNFALAQNYYPYISVLKVPNNKLMIGVEIFDLKTKSSKNFTGFEYEISFNQININPKKEIGKYFLTPLKDYKDQFSINLKVSKPFSDKQYSFNDLKIKLDKPKAKIVVKNNKVLSPLTNKISSNKTLTVLTKDFISNKLTYTWRFNGAFLSNNQEIFLYNLKNQRGIISVTVNNPLTKESAQDEMPIEIY